MSVNLRLPNITAENAEQQMSQMKSYLYQLVEQLNWALETVSHGNPLESSAVEIIGGKEQISEEDAKKTFNSIKSLIIKSADIVEAYADKMSQSFDGRYLAQSDFGVYEERTRQLIETNSTDITNLYTQTQNLLSTIDGIEQSIIDTQAWIKQGLLDYDSQGVPVYGLEVGQKSIVDDEEVFNKYARFTADGIFFYLPGVSEAVAWMSGQKLYITNVEITGTMKLGYYVFDGSDGGITVRFIGGA